MSFTETPRKVAGLQKPAARGYFAYWQCGIADVAQESVSAFQTYPHQCAAERAVIMRKQIMQVTL